MALAHYESGLCDCGFHDSLTADKTNVFTFEERVCPVCAGSARYDRRQRDTDRKFLAALGDDPPPMTPEPSDGRRTFMRLLSPTEAAEKRTQSSSARRP